MQQDIQDYNQSVKSDRRDICERLADEIIRALPDAESKVWHGAPVWFIDGNPVVGYGDRKNHVQLLFWSGQTFNEAGLQPEGTFKAAEARYTDMSQIDSYALQRWLRASVEIQWDYKNIVKRKGVLERLK
jgi:hypothetical protein